MKKTSLLLHLVTSILAVSILVIQSLGALAFENSSSQIQTSTPAPIQKQTQQQTQQQVGTQTEPLPQITSQVVAPTVSQEAIAACSGLYEKDSCQFHKNNTLVNGACKILPSGNNNYELGCQPEQSTKNAAIDPDKDSSAGNAKEPHQHKHKRS